MDTIALLVGFILHIDQHLAAFALNHGNWVYGLLFLIVFVETGLIVMPFLPGDSLLFVTGALCGTGTLKLPWAIGLLSFAAIAGDQLNYRIGSHFGPRVFRWQDSRLFNKRAFDQAHAFYKRHGGVTIVLARFMPFIRTFAPFRGRGGADGSRPLHHLQRDRWGDLGVQSDGRGFPVRKHRLGAGQPEQDHLGAGAGAWADCGGGRLDGAPRCLAWNLKRSIAIWSRAKWAGGLAIVLAALTSWARVFLGVHFPFDILGSMAVAVAAVAALVTLRATIDRNITCRIHQGVPNAKAHVMSITGDDRPPRSDLT